MEKYNESTKLFKSLIYVSLFILSTLIYGLQKLSHQLPEIINNYFNDIISTALLLKVCHIILKLIKGADFNLSLGHIVFVWLYFSFLFEGLLPLYYERYTADVYDVGAYLLGALIYIILEGYDLHKMFKMRRVYKKRDL
ncbi:MAG TPA: hypothetical protein VKY33_03520 [Flavobacterium sp.]|nr:hypothetical protein [Flavobacterium sp.]